MNPLSVKAPTTKVRRRRHSSDFKAQVVAACKQPGTSLSRVALDHALNANLVRRWVREAEMRSDERSSTPGFLPLAMSSQPSVSARSSQPDQETLRIELPSPRGTVIMHWPVSQADRCLAWLQSFLR